MSDFVTLECKYCGNADRSTFIIRESEYICKCCGRCYREASSGGEARVAIGFEMLKNYDFSAAENIFSDIVSEYSESIDARWGLLLARYGIVFVKGFYMGEIEPIYCFPNISYSKGAFTDEQAYKEIEELLRGDEKRMELYRAQAEQIESALDVYKGDVGKEKENDVFICVKISKTTANNPYAKGTTEDYEKACELYGKLRERGKRVFFSYVTLKNTIDSDMEIWRNMLKSKKMLLIGSRTEYLNSVWVKSEWERWLWLDNAGGDEHKKNFYIYILGDESENLYSKLPAGIKKFHPQIYTASTESDLLNDICRGDKTEASKAQKPERAEKAEKPKKQEKASALEPQESNVNGYVEFLNGSREPISAQGFALYWGRNDVVKAVIPEGITEITKMHFSECANLERVYLPKSITKIEAGAFSGCRRLSSIEIPTGVTEIEPQTFYMCKNLSSVKLPFGLQKIGSGAFMLCGNLKKIELPKTLSEIGDEAFCSSGIQSISLPRTVLKIGERAFSGCNGLKKIKINDTISYIGEDAFGSDTKITYIGESEDFRKANKGASSYSNLVCESDLNVKIHRAVVLINIIALLAIIAAAVIIPFFVNGALHWCIAIAGGIILNMTTALISRKGEFVSFQFVVNILEIIACGILLFFTTVNNSLMIYILGVSLGMLIANIYMSATNPERRNRVYIYGHNNQKDDYFEAASIFIWINLACIILAILGIIFDPIVSFGVLFVVGIVAGITAIAFNATT